MPRGAAPGERRGGRAKGTPNRRTQQQLRAIAECGITPLEYLVSVMRDESESREVRIDAAGKAAPYCHARLSSTDMDLVATMDNRSPVELSDADLLRVIALATRPDVLQWADQTKAEAAALPGQVADSVPVREAVEKT